MASDPRIGSTLAGYRIESLLGRGGMSVVYLATDVDLERKVALKLLAPELAEQAGFRERFIRESRLAASLDHPNVIPIYEAGEADGVLFIAMRYVPGTDLKVVIEAEGAMEPARVVSLVAQVAGALDEAHKEGLVHRDVKPANVLLATRRGEAAEHVYLSDFGVTKRRLSAGGLTATGQLVGTVDYVAPEQVKGEAVDGRADVYSLGCMTFECLTGQTPFQRDTEVAVLWAQVQTPPPAATELRPDLPLSVDEVLGRAMAKSPDERPQTAGAFARALGAALIPPAEAVSVAPAPTESGRLSPRWRRRPWALVALAATLAVLVAGVSFALVRKDHPAPVSPTRGTAITANLQRIDVASGKLLAGIDVPAAGINAFGNVSTVAVGGGFVWAMSAEGLIKVNDRNTALATIRVGTGPELQFSTVVTGDGAVWAGVGGDRPTSRIVRVDPTTNRITKVIPITNTSAAAASVPVTIFAVNEGSIWVLDRQTSSLLRLDAASGRIIRRISLDATPDGLVVGEEGIWVRCNGAIASVIRVDPRTNRVSARIQLPGGADGLAVGGGSVWVADSSNDTVVKIDPATASVARTIPVGHDPGSLVVDERGDLWVNNTGDRTIVKITPAGSVEQTVKIAGKFAQHGLAAGFGSIWLY